MDERRVVGEDDLHPAAALDTVEGALTAFMPEGATLRPHTTGSPPADAAVAASPGQEPAAPPAGSSESPAATAAAGIPGPLQASDHIGPCIEAADEAALRRALRAVATQLDGLRQVARASQALGETAKSAAHDRQAAAAQAPDTWCAAGRAPADLAADAVDAYFSSLGFATAAVHIGYCVNGMAAPLPHSLGLPGPPPPRAPPGHPPPPTPARRG